MVGLLEGARACGHGDPCFIRSPVAAARALRPPFGRFCDTPFRRKYDILVFPFWLLTTYREVVPAFSFMKRNFFNSVPPSWRSLLVLAG